MSAIPQDFLEASYEFSIGGDAGPAFIVLGHSVDVATSTQAAADFLSAQMGGPNGLVQLMHNSVTHEGVTVRRNSGLPSLEVAESPDGQSGVNAGAPLPWQVAMLVRKISGLAGRANRGRMYVPGATEANVNDDGRLLPSFISFAQPILDSFLADLVGLNLDLVILHALPGPSPVPVNTLVLDSLVATQRRRIR